MDKKDNMTAYILDLITSPPVNDTFHPLSYSSTSSVVGDLKFISDPAPPSIEHLPILIKERDDLLKWSLDILEELEATESSYSDSVNQNLSLKDELKTLKGDYEATLVWGFTLEDELSELKLELIKQCERIRQLEAELEEARRKS